MKSKYKTKEEEITSISEPTVAYGSISYRNFVIQNDYSLVKTANEGIDTGVFYSFAESIKMPEKILASVLNLSSRTVSNYREQRKSLEPNHSEHLLKLIILYEKGKEYLGNIDEFNNWLERPFWNSEDKPLDFLNTSGGVDLLIDRLERMAQGFPA